MARLIVTASLRIQWPLLATGYLIHCKTVTDINGEPVTGLTMENFKVDPMIAGAAFACDISNVFAGRLPWLLLHYSGPA